MEAGKWIGYNTGNIGQLNIVGGKRHGEKVKIPLRNGKEITETKEILNHIGFKQAEIDYFCYKIIPKIYHTLNESDVYLLDYLGVLLRIKKVGEKRYNIVANHSNRLIINNLISKGFLPENGPFDNYIKDTSEQVNEILN